MPEVSNTVVARARIRYCLTHALPVLDEAFPEITIDLVGGRLMVIPNTDALIPF